MNKSRPKVGIVLLNWNGWKDTIECIKSFKEVSYHNFQIIVVDNGSTDDSVKKLSNLKYPITLIETGKNLGFAGGNNVGIHHALKAGNEYIMLLNNDTTVDKKFLTIFVNYAEKNPKVGALTGKIYYFSDPDRFWFAGAEKGKLGEMPGHRGYNERDTGQYDSVTETDLVSGCLFFARAKALKKVGLLDDNFFWSYEDADWTDRFKRAHFECRYLPKAVIWHKVSSSRSNYFSPLFLYYEEKGRLLWQSKNIPDFSTTDKISQTASYLWQTWQHAKNNHQSAKSGLCLIFSRIIGVIDYLFHKMGPAPSSIMWLHKIYKQEQL